MKRTVFEQELSELLNKHSQENSSNTPDFLLAQFLIMCLTSWNKMTLARDRWYSVHLEPGFSHFKLGLLAPEKITRKRK